MSFRFPELLISDNGLQQRSARRLVEMLQSAGENADGATWKMEAQIHQYPVFSFILTGQPQKPKYVFVSEGDD